MRRWMWGLVGGLLIATALPAMAQEGSEGAEAFVRGVFAAYIDGEEPAGPMAETRLDEVWTPRMAALIRRDRELSGGDLPYLDADPLCNCQDWERLVVQTVRISGAQPEGRTATVVFTNGGERGTTIVRLRGNPNAGWRIDDVLSPGQPGLAARLAEANGRIEQGD
ncbi:DUF3828 domain-containing protein [Brevundimonas sp.]|uniref:DUF3828 domain-containing protein n=1 Tax=Brevundimonas sp. TaxID=1871086 RepID=UPI002D65DEB7|nr:DUF3828 domain-containing protein [Brevundimonas sp.]HYC97083.1 DUF3828 domain-containing protein [Brevundimonas sp.]